jgi:hypothetical protein
MARSYDILILGASYGSLLGAKLVLAGHRVSLVCLPAEADLINREGAVVRLPVRGRAAPVVLNSRAGPGRLVAGGAETFDPARFDLIGLAMQEPQYRSAGVRELMGRIAAARRPVMSIMNMPPLPFLKRLPGLDTAGLRGAYADATVWDAFDPALMTLASPDPQAFRPPGEPVNVLQVGLPTNFKVAAFGATGGATGGAAGGAAGPDALLRDLEAGIDAIRHDAGEGPIELPVKLRVHDSVFVPLAKWAMLVTGNYRCVTDGEMKPIREAVHGDLALSRQVYDWVCSVCRALGASADDLVPFEKYAKAAEGLLKPSSVARAIAAGAPAVERVDRLVQAVADGKGMKHPVLDAAVATVDARLAANRPKG